MTNLTELPAHTAMLADNDILYMRDVSDPANPDKKIEAIYLRPAGAKVTDLFRFEGQITIPNLAAGAEGDPTVTIAGVQVGDHAVFNLAAALPANLAILHAWVSADNTLKVRFRNLHSADPFVTVAINCVAVVTRTIAP